MRRKATLSTYVEPEQLETLQQLAKGTHVPMAEYVRAGVALCLAQLRCKANGCGRLPADGGPVCGAGCYQTKRPVLGGAT